ncbi:MAG: MFS transporter [Candidatus Thermoplasmatota archaeon]|nr:MFS transporter [Candidatus Thermoplasmatota archaeon]
MGTRSGRAKGLSAGLTFNVYLLGLVSLLTDLSSEMIFPLLPFFLLTELGATAFIFGIFEGARESTGSLLKVFSGYWSDRIGQRKGLVIAGYSVSSAMKAAIPFVRVWPHLMVVGVMERVGKGLRDAPRDAVFADTTPTEARGKVFGFHRLLDTLGAVLGPLTAFVLLDAFGLPFREIFLIAVGPALVSALLTLFIRERARRPKDVPSLRVGFATLSPALRRFILVATVFALGHFSVLFLLLRVVGVGLTEGTGILFYVAFNLVYALTAFPVGILSDRLGRPPIILVGYLAFAFMTGGLILFAEAWQLLLLFGLFGLSSAFVNAVERAFVADLAPPNLRATALGTYHTLTGVARFPASAVAGFLWIVTPTATFAYGLILALLASLLLTLFMVRRSWTTETL